MYRKKVTYGSINPLDQPVGGGAELWRIVVSGSCEMFQSGRWRSSERFSLYFTVFLLWTRWKVLLFCSDATRMSHEPCGHVQNQVVCWPVSCSDQIWKWKHTRYCRCIWLPFFWCTQTNPWILQWCNLFLVIWQKVQTRRHVEIKLFCCI